MSQRKNPDSTRPRSQRTTAPSKTLPGEATTQQEPILLQPAPDDREGWKIYWTGRQQPWRTEPEISTARQNELEARRSIIPDIGKGIYPFKDVKLNRADVEWLLITHENGRGPVYWNDGQHIERVGLDLRGADLRHANLENLPLARMIGGLQHWNEWELATEEQRQAAGVHLEHAQLKSTHLESAKLRCAYLQAANLRYAHLTSAMLFQAHLEEASLFKAHLEDTNLREAHLEGASLCLAFLDRATTLNKAILVNKRYGPASLLDVHWGEMNVAAVDWSQLTILGEEYKILKGLTHGPLSPYQPFRHSSFKLG